MWLHLIFPHYLINGTNFGEIVIEILYVLILFEIFLILKIREIVL
jgi:hypothetical protein